MNNNVVITIFEVESEAFQAFSELRNAPAAAGYAVPEAILIKNSGGNIDVSFIHKVVEKGLLTRGRNMKFKTLMQDVPGALEQFCTVVRSQNANIIEVQYDRFQADLGLRETIIHMAVEVSGRAHGEALIKALNEAGYRSEVE